jgi:hypothetical protein
VPCYVEEMSHLYIYTLFSGDGRPRCTGVKVGDKIHIYELFRPGARKPIIVINEHKQLIRDLIVKANRAGHTIITSDFKAHLTAFNLPLDRRPYNVYDLHLDDMKATDSYATDVELVKGVLTRIMQNARVLEYQKVYANAAVVYQSLENHGLKNNDRPAKPIWSQKVYSGRSKTLGFNIQGFSDNHQILPIYAGPNDVLIHFDWICADIRVASLLSGDQRLQQAFTESDPYTYMMNIINANSKTPITRSECKKVLLRAINSMDTSSVALSDIYRDLGAWISRCRRATQEKDGYLETILKRRFKMARARKEGRSELSVLNGVMQGSVAHGMQNVIRRVWEVLETRLVTEIHDSLVVSSPPEPNEQVATIRAIVPLMLYPFAGLLPDNPIFPLKVSIGPRWKEWKLRRVYRSPRGENVTEETAAVEDEAESGSSPEAEESGSGGKVEETPPEERGTEGAG